MRKMAAVFLILFLFLSAASCATIHVNESSRLAQGAGSFVFSQPGVASGKAITVYYYLPRNLGPRPAVVILMHGMSRTAEKYRNTWIKYADQYGFLILAPHFSKAGFPSYRDYNMGNMQDKEGNLIPREQWAFNVVEALFDQVKKENGFATDGYYIYGHSAGGQFVQRFVLFMAGARFKLAIAANPGWYAMPVFDVRLPYGLACSGLTEKELHKALGRRLCILVGEKDNDPNAKYLRNNAKTRAQGGGRLDRGRSFYRMGKSAAEKDNAPFGWFMETVPGVAHSPRGMSRPAAGIIHEDMLKYKQ